MGLWREGGGLDGVGGAMLEVSKPHLGGGGGGVRRGSWRAARGRPRRRGEKGDTAAAEDEFVSRPDALRREAAAGAHGEVYIASVGE